MTEDYKEDILNYIVNQVSITPGDNEQHLESTESIVRSAFEDYLPQDAVMLSIAGAIKSTTNGNYILYGGYTTVNLTSTTEADSKGIIIILDRDLQPIKTIYKFSTGTLLRPIQKLIQVEDETFVGVDSTIFTLKYDRGRVQTNTKRFIMLNNISVKDTTNDYRVILRTSYNIPYSNFYCIDMLKNPNSSHYVMSGAMYIPYGNNNHRDGARVIELKINVGEANEWSDITTNTSEYWIYGGFYGEFDNDDNLSWKMILTRYTTNNRYVVSWAGSSIKTIMQEDANIIPYVDSLAMSNQAVFKNKNELYFVVNNQRWGSAVQPRYIGLYKYEYTTSALKQIYFKNIGNYDYYSSREGIFLNSLDGELYVNYCDNYDYSESTANYNYQRLVDDTWDPILIQQDAYYRMEETVSFTSNVYNLLTNIIFNARMDSMFYFQVIKEIFNPFNYNGTEYNNYNSMIANSGTLYRDNGILFARNLYNTTLLDATTTSTIQIPNTLLNNVSIATKNLIGETNIKLITDNTPITKNVYETLYINFIRSINVIDEDTNKTFPVASSYINQNINVGTKQNCENTFVGKVRINYEDNSIMQNINWTYNTDHYETSFVIDAINEAPSSIDFMSYDESTIYITKDLNIQSGNYKIVSQKLRIE